MEKVKKINDNVMNFDFVSLYPSVMPNLSGVAKKLARERLIVERKEKLNRLYGEDN